MDGRTYAFIALERIGGVMVYDVTDPAQAVFVNYINSREFDDAIQGDVSPEGLCFVPAAQSAGGKALLLAACEVSGTLAVYTCTGNAVTPPQEEQPQPEPPQPEPPQQDVTPEEGGQHYYPDYQEPQAVQEVPEQPVFVPDEDAVSPKTGDDGETQLWIVCAIALCASFALELLLKKLANR